jgi:ubiquinone/menaquinone biosynthesis C-methylase UbiE
MVNNSGNQSDASQVRQSWVKYDGIMDEKLECVSDILFRSIGTPEGLRFLDIGCGAGSTTIRLGKLVSSTASVTGIDISEPMVSFARGKAKGIDNVDFVLDNAQTYEFEPSKFDGAISRMGVMFFTNPIQAFSNIHSALNKGSFLTFACWAPTEEGELTDLLLRSALKHTRKPHNDPGTGGGQAFNDKEYVKSILSDSGFSNLSIETLKIHQRARISPEEDASVNMAIGCAHNVMVNAEADDDIKKRIHEELLTIAKEHQDGDYVGYYRSIHVVSAIT